MKNMHIDIFPDLVYYPVVDLSYETGLCEISGESYMEETYKFYEPIITWIRDYTSENKPITLSVKLTYFNTSSSRFILEILDILKKYKERGGNVEVNWHYKKDDTDILTEINDFIDESGLAINVFPLF